MSSPDEIQQRIKEISEKCPDLQSNNVFISPFILQEEDLLLLFAENKNRLEILDGSHDLALDKEQINPLIDYCNHFIENEGIIYINLKKIILNNQNKWAPFTDLSNLRSQVNIKNGMKVIIMDFENKELMNELKRSKYENSYFEKVSKELKMLQKHLGETMDLDTTIIETHRGGNPINDIKDVNQKYCFMYKSKLSTRFDLNANLGIPFFEIGEIKDNYESLKGYENEKKIDICRYFGNYFPNSLSIFIKKKELFDEGFFTEQIQKIIDIYNYNISDAKKIVESIYKYIKNLQNDSIKLFFEKETDDSLYLLHMFTEYSLNPKYIYGSFTFSLQKDAVTADQVTNELFGVRKRNCLSLSALKPLNKSLLLLSNMSSDLKNCHVLYGKTCGDGVAIEFVKLYSYIYKKNISILSSDICCDYRNLFENGCSIRQLPTKLAGTGLGLLETERQIEIYKNIEIQSINILEKNYPLIFNFFQSNLKDYDVGQKFDILRLKFRNRYNTTLQSTQLSFPGPFSGIENIKPEINIILNNEIDNLREKLEKKYDLKDNDYLKLILKLSLYKFGEKICRHISNYITIYEKIFKKTEYDITDCNLIKDMLSCPYFLTNYTDQIENTVEDFMNSFMNLNKIILDIRASITNKEFNNNQINQIIENNFKIIASMENLFQTIFLDDPSSIKSDLAKIKQHTLFNLINALYGLGDRMYNRYIPHLINKLKEYSIINNVLNSDFDALDFNAQYSVILFKFNEIFKTTKQRDNLYNEKQKIKQPLNLLKYILRAINSLNKYYKNNKGQIDFKYNIDNFKKLDQNYEKIVEDTGSPVITPAGTQIITSPSIKSQPVITQNTPSPSPKKRRFRISQSSQEEILFSPESPKPTPEAVEFNNLINSLIYEEPSAELLQYNIDSPKEEVSLGSQTYKSPTPGQNIYEDEDLETILSPLDDDVKNLCDMDESELNDYYKENGLLLNTNDLNIDQEQTPEKVFDINLEKILGSSLINNKNSQQIIDFNYAESIRIGKENEVGINEEIINERKIKINNLLMNVYNTFKEGFLNIFNVGTPREQLNEQEVFPMSSELAATPLTSEQPGSIIQDEPVGQSINQPEITETEQSQNIKRTEGETIRGIFFPKGKKQKKGGSSRKISKNRKYTIKKK